jgi:eukaryotic-like serine/threonine-protein kinase
MISGTDVQKGDPRLVRFQREARAAGAIETQHIAQVFDIDEDPATGAPFIVMELLQGEDMQALLDRCGPLPVDVALRIVGQACIGLQRAHEAGVIHRDVKPSNLFLARREEREVVVKLLDFGIAKILERTGGVGSPVGTLLYMSPEQMLGAPDVDERTDIYALGGTLYCALAGEPPMKSAPMLAVLVAHLRTGPPPITEVAPWVSPEVASVVTRAMQRDPAERFASAEAMLDALRSLLGGDLTLREGMLPPARASCGAAEVDAAPEGSGLVDPFATTADGQGAEPGVRRRGAGR